MMMEFLQSTGYEFIVVMTKADKLKKELDEKSFEEQRTNSKINMLHELEKNMEGYQGSVKAVMKSASHGTKFVSVFKNHTRTYFSI